MEIIATIYFVTGERILHCFKSWSELGQFVSANHSRITRLNSYAAPQEGETV